MIRKTYKILEDTIATLHLSYDIFIRNYLLHSASEAIIRRTLHFSLWLSGFCDANGEATRSKLFLAEPLFGILRRIFVKHEMNPSIHVP